jgi:hypothetical protein
VGADADGAVGDGDGRSEMDDAEADAAAGWQAFVVRQMRTTTACCLAFAFCLAWATAVALLRTPATRSSSLF